MKLEAISGLEVSVHVNGQQLQEYEDDSDHLYIPSIDYKYIEATAGANFVVAFRTKKNQLHSPSPLDAIQCDVELDGKFVCGKIPEINKRAYDFEMDMEGKHVNTGYGACAVKPFQFSDLKTNDGSTKNVDMKAMSQLGEIKVKCYWVRTAGEHMPLAYNPLDRTASDDKSIPEKCLKGRAISSKASLGKEKAVVQQYTVTTTKPYGDKPFATFIFKYRSRRDLQIEGIIERSPEPTPLEDRDPDSLTAEEVRELVRRLRVQQEDQVRIKREKRARSATIGGDDDDDNDVTVSSEGSRRKRQRQSTDSGIDVVDLTED